MTASEFAALLRNGMLEADKTYRDWTNGWVIADGGIEGFITTTIAGHVIKETRRRQGPEGGYVALELMLDRLIFDLSPNDRREHFNRLLNETRASNIDPEIANSLKQQARLDLVFYDGAWPENSDKLRPRGIVEVKRWFDANTYPKDMRRIANLLNAFGPRNGGSLQYGCFVFFLFERDNARKSLQEVIEKIEASRTDFGIYGRDCQIEKTLLPTAASESAKAASISVTFEAQA